MTTLSIDIDLLNNESLRALCYALLQGGPEMRHPAEELRCFRTVEGAIAVLEARPLGAARTVDVSELREMLDHWRAGIRRRAEAYYAEANALA